MHATSLFIDAVATRIEATRRDHSIVPDAASHAEHPASDSPTSAPLPATPTPADNAASQRPNLPQMHFVLGVPVVVDYCGVHVNDGLLRRHSGLFAKWTLVCVFRRLPPIPRVAFLCVHDSGRCRAIALPRRVVGCLCDDFELAHVGV